MQPISNSFLRKDVRNQILSGDQDIKLRERDIALKTRRLLVKLADLASLKSVLINCTQHSVSNPTQVSQSSLSLSKVHCY